LIPIFSNGLDLLAHAEVEPGPADRPALVFLGEMFSKTTVMSGFFDPQYSMNGRVELVAVQLALLADRRLWLGLRRVSAERVSRIVNRDHVALFPFEPSRLAGAGRCRENTCQPLVAFIGCPPAPT
jgi:hypothetical protein